MSSSNSNSTVKAKVSLNSPQKVALIRQDIDDTLQNQISTVDFLYKLYSLDSTSDIDENNEIVDDAEIDAVLSEYDGNYINFPYQGSQYTISVNKALKTVHVQKLIHDGYEDIGYLVHYVQGQGFVLTSNIVDQSGEVIMRVSDSVISDVNDQVASTEVLSALATAATNCDFQNPDALLQKFSNIVGDYDANSEASALKDDIKKALGQMSSDSSSAFSILSSIYEDLSTIDIDSDGDITLNSNRFHVSGFFGSAGVKLVQQTATLVVSTIMTAIHPILGFISYGVTQIGSAIATAWKEMSADVQRDVVCENNIYAQPIVSIKGAFPSGSAGTFFSNLLDEADSMGSAITISYPVFDILLWRSKDHSTLYLEVYGKVRRTGFSLKPVELMKCFLDSSSVTYTHWNYHYGSWTNYYPGVVGSKFESFVYYLTTCAVDQLNGTDELNGITMTNDMSLSDVSISLFCFVMMLYDSSVDNVDLSGSINASDVNSAIKLLKWTSQLYRGTGSPSWSGLVNTIIPNLNSNLLYFSDISDLWYGLYTFLNGLKNVPLDSSWTSGYLYNYYPDLNDGSNDYFCPVFYLPDRYRCFLYPPTASPTAKFKTIMALLGIALATTAVVVTAAVVRAKIRKHNAKAYLNVARKQSKYMDNEDPTKDKELWNDYYSSLKKYNRFAGLAGRSRLATTSGWEVGDTITPSKATGLYDTISGVLPGSTPVTLRSLQDSQSEESQDLADLINGLIRG